MNWWIKNKCRKICHWVIGFTLSCLFRINRLLAGEKNSNRAPTSSFGSNSWESYVTADLLSLTHALQPLRKNLIQTLALPHFDYCSIVFMNFDKTRTLALQTAQNACVHFIFGNIPYIPTADITTHVTHRRLELGCLSITTYIWPTSHAPSYLHTIHHT